MRREVNSISGRLSLRAPQRDSLVILDRVAEIIGLEKRVRQHDTDLDAVRDIIASEYPTVSDFERDFPSLCFALATGVGKTRLMGAFIAYLHAAYGLRNYFVLAPNLTIYDKLIQDFTPNTPKYVFKGIAAFATTPPIIVTGDNYEEGLGTKTSLFTGYGDEITINIFNISKINSEVRGGKSPRIKRLAEYIGQSYFDYLASLPDLVLLMDESHRYRASAGARAINDLKPLLGLELTATPFIETSRGAIPFKNVIYDYPLARAIQDGFVKSPAVVTRENFVPSRYDRAALEKLKLEDGVVLHESVKVELETYARQTGRPRVKPFVLVIARDTTHAASLLDLIQSDEFFDGRYADKVIQVDSSTKKKEEAMVARLLQVESTDEPTEIVIHVNMLKEGWDVTNLYTIVPLRAANARVLIEQSIGRGLRLPYSKRTGVAAVDRLSIVAHDKFQEIVDEANRPDSAIRLEQVILPSEPTVNRSTTIVSTPTIASALGFANASPLPLRENSDTAGGDSTPAPRPLAPILATPEAQQVGRLVYQSVMQRTQQASLAAFDAPALRQEVIREAKENYLPPAQTEMALDGVSAEPDFEQIADIVLEQLQQRTIEIPRITVVPIGAVAVGFRPFTLDLSSVNYQPVEQDLVIQELQSRQRETLRTGSRVAEFQRLEDNIVFHLIDFNDISYDDTADLLYDLAGQTVAHVRGYLLDEADVANVIQYHAKPLATLIHAQMQVHRWEESAGYETRVLHKFSELKEAAFTVSADKVRNFRDPVPELSKIKQYVFVGFSHCLYDQQKFDSNAERLLAIILDRETDKWFKPARGQFQIYYQLGTERPQYDPDFVAETDEAIFMLEPKARGNMQDDDVLAKRDAAVSYCAAASAHNASHGGKPWHYLLIRHDVITESMTLAGLAAQFLQE